MTRLGAALALGLLGLAAPASARAEGTATSAPAPAGELDALFARFAAMPGLQARFAEDKQLSLLVTPLHSEGTIHFLRGRGVVVHTTSPTRQSTLVTDRQLVLWDGRTVRRVDLDASPSVAAFARAFTLLLGADREALERAFTLALQGRADDGWTLRLVPVAAAARNVVATIELEGKGLILSTLRIREANGDLSTMRFTGVDVQRRYTGAEADRIFRVPPP